MQKNLRFKALSLLINQVGTNNNKEILFLNPKNYWIKLMSLEDML